jgi:hypothetical protein
MQLLSLNTRKFPRFSSSADYKSNSLSSKLIQSVQAGKCRIAISAPRLAIVVFFVIFFISSRQTPGYFSNCNTYECGWCGAGTWHIGGGGVWEHKWCDVKFHTEDLQILSAILQDLVATATCRPSFVHTWLTGFSRHGDLSPEFCVRLTYRIYSPRRTAARVLCTLDLQDVFYIFY